MEPQIALNSLKRSHFQRLPFPMSSSFSPRPPWRSLLEQALKDHRDRPESRYFQLATVRPNGKPANRSVVFRGFLDSTHQLQIVTDNRSDKIHQLHHSPWAEICWYFSLTRQQFRISAQTTCIDENTDPSFLLSKRRQVWQQLSDATRQQFTWPACGTDRDKNGFPGTYPNPDTLLPNFVLVLFQPIEVDLVDLRESPPQRIHYQLQPNGDWSERPLNP